LGARAAAVGDRAGGDARGDALHAQLGAVLRDRVRGRVAVPALPRARRAAACLLAVALLTVVLAWISSQLSPAWANQYLAVGVAPLLLVGGAGLAYAG